MLPFLKPKQVTGLIIAKRKSDGSNEVPETETDEYEGLHAASDDLINAIHAKDRVATTAALKAAFDMHMSRADEGADDIAESDAE